ncbi:hypothetical protein QTG56_24600 (plasmid) [Rossellomorea sp. AcN35-11]|nr:hypothetical protein [Rossellomorea aquimaris]WJV31816.1 hypothetical protein QTG56_24600 [Rossellomorea sp. AcN35-11]
MEKRSKKKPIILAVSLLVLTVIGVFVVYGQMYTNKAEEMWAFRGDALDKEFFPLREEVASCVFGADDKVSKFMCDPGSITKRIEETKSSISTYELSYEDTQAVKQEVLNGLEIMDSAVEEAVKLNDLSKDDSAVVEVTKNILDKRDELAQNTKDINEIVNEYYQ